MGNRSGLQLKLYPLYFYDSVTTPPPLHLCDKGDGMEEVVACSWDGHTYIANLKKEVVRFVFPENVAAFCAGKSAHGKHKRL